MLVDVNVIAKRRVFNDFFKIDEVELRYRKFNGEMSRPVTRLVFERGDAVAAVLFNTDTRRLIFVRQFRPPCYEKGPGWMTEIIAGMIDPGEKPDQAIRREVFEETGYRVRDARAISTFYLSPGGSSERIFLYYAEVGNATHEGAGGGIGSEDEDIQLVEMSVSEAIAGLSEDGFCDAKTMIGLLSVKEHLLHHD
jgi:nudix-type nucleoside diphosphatase (YffH/AdpP family)